MTRSGPLLRVSPSRAELAVGRRGAAALVQPADEIAFEDASPTRREFNDRRPFAERDQTLERTPSEAGDRSGLIVGVDGERGLPAPHCRVTAFVPGQACRTSRQDAHPPVGMRNDVCLGRRVSQTSKPLRFRNEAPSFPKRSPFTSLASVESLPCAIRTRTPRASGRQGAASQASIGSRSRPQHPRLRLWEACHR
jgi:hypothetical protein